jgi:predicted patatin/cPLA2 family phospholipase
MFHGKKMNTSATQGFETLVFDTLVLSGGALKGVAQLGALKYIEDTVGLESIDYFYGTSIGAVISYLLIIGFSPMEIIQTVIKSKLMDKLIATFNLFQMFQSRGIVNINLLMAELELITILKTERVFTLRELYDCFGKELHCIAYNYSQRRVEHLSYLTHPDMDSITAIRLSSALPFVFEDVYYNGDLYLDGGIANNFPVEYVPSGHKILGLVLFPELKPQTVDETLVQFIHKLLYIPLIEKTKSAVARCAGIEHIHIVPIEFDMTGHVPLHAVDLFKVFSIGYSIIKDYVHIRNHC